jgi:F-type H+-transporting ATPase subunit gamma
MEMVAASKMRRAQEQAVASRLYAAKSWEILTYLAAFRGSAVNMLHPLLTRREHVGKIGILMITADKGLAGAYNSNLIRAVTRFMHEHNRTDAKLVTVGRKGRDFMMRYKRAVIAEFSDLPARPRALDITPIAQIVLDGFLEGEFDEVYLAYTSFINTLSQVPTIRLLLPIQTGEIEDPAMRNYFRPRTQMLKNEYLFEPDPAGLLETILPRFTELQIYQAVLESFASEHSARMVAMRNATENAKGLISDLKLTYNKVRQDTITKEMLDIVGGAEALAG